MQYLYLVRLNAIKSIHLESSQSEDLTLDMSLLSLRLFKDLGCLAHDYKSVLVWQV